MDQLHSPISPTEQSPKQLLLSVFTQVHLEKPVIDPSFVGIVSFHGND
jgi:hypothetical protein